ncbi:MAG: hypothetical protein P8Q98_05805, partial [Candidatus Poseidoniaceae archaeon]|nr:hypothetical protein [Candidatus Poseidoniaceae archaeon]
IIALLVIGVLGGGAVLFLRRNGQEEEPTKSFEQTLTASPGVVMPAAQPATIATPVAAQPVAQPVAQEPTVLQQWTDENGYTWRSMSDGTTHWWTGTEWQRA